MKIQHVYMFLCLVLLFGNCSNNDDIYTIEIKDGVKYVHNRAPLWGDESKIGLEFLQKIGVIEGKNENYLLYKPTCIAEDMKHNIYILDSGNYRIQKFDSNGRYLKTFGRRGQGPGEFFTPVCLAIDTIGTMYIGDIGINRIIILDSNGKEIRRIKLNSQKPIFILTKMNEFLVINEWGYETQLLPQAPPGYRVGHSFKLGRPHENNLLQLFDCEGNCVNEFLPIQHYEDSFRDTYFNEINYTIDSNSNIYVAYKHKNLIEKYDSNNNLILKIDRLKNYQESSGDVIESSISNLKPPIVNQFSHAIDIDSKGRIWVMSFIKHPTPEELVSKKPITNVTVFEIYAEDGTLLSTIPWKYYVDGLTFKIFNDNIYIIDPNNEMCVYQYKIVEIQ